MNRAATTVIAWILSVGIYALAGVSLYAQSAGNQNPSAIILPLELVASQPATLAVLTADGHVAPGVKVALSNGEVVTTDESGRAHFLAPLEVGLLFARIPNTEVSEVADVLQQASGTDSLQVTSIPKMVSLRNYFSIGGYGFRGDADRNQVKIEGEAVLVLASSPVELVVMPALNLTPGQGTVTVTEGAAETVTDITLVNVTTLNSLDTQVHRGEKGEIVFLVRGTEMPLNLRIQNLNPETAQLAHSTVNYVRTTGGLDNSAILQFKGRNAGLFSFAITVEGVVGKPNAPVAHDFLATAQKVAEPHIADRITKILNRFRGKNIEIVKVQDDLQQLLPDASSRDVQALIRASLRTLNSQ